MGMTRAFYYIVNKDFTQEAIREILHEIAVGAKETVPLPAQMGKMLKNLGGDDKLMELVEMLAGANQLFGEDTIVAWREGVKMFPLFDWQRCEGCIATDMDNDVLEQYFKAPVLSFSVMDSDVLFVSYRDRSKRERADMARPNCHGHEEELFDTEVYKVGFPDFLLHYCDKEDEQKLRDIWEADDYVFAEERMEDICELLGLDIIYDADSIPEEYEVLTSVG